MLRLPDHWVWDSWVADDGTDYHLRDGRSVIIGFRNLEPKGGLGFEIIDPIPVTLDAKGHLVARDA